VTNQVAGILEKVAGESDRRGFPSDVVEYKDFLVTYAT